MCKAKDYSEQLLEIYNSINAEVKRLETEVKTTTLFDLDMLHIIENTNFNACEGYKFAKQIRDNRLLRRQAKNELDTIKQLKNNIVESNMELLIQTYQEIVNKDNYLNGLVANKVYSPRVIGKAVQVPTIVENKSTPEPISKTVIPINSVLSGRAIYKKTKEEIQLLNKVSDTQFLVKRKDGRVEILSKKYIVKLNNVNGVAI